MRTFRARTVLLLLVLAVLATPAFGGYGYNEAYSAVEVSGGWRMQGTLGATRRSPDTTRRFYCRVQSGTNLYYADCYAYDGVESLVCTTSAPNLVDTIRSIHPEDHVAIDVSSGTCTTIVVRHDSARLPGVQP